LKPSENSEVLDLGVTSENEVGANFFDYKYPFLSKLTCIGMQDAHRLCADLPNITFIKLEGLGLPFIDKQFDILHCNAVIEHVGSRKNQEEFINEIIRVSKSFYITTPNRWFSIEMHTHIPLIHYFPKNFFRWILNLIGEKFYSSEENLNLLTVTEIIDFLPKNTYIKTDFVKCFDFNSNINVYGATDSKL
jgi:ubiquinone/menaquinone biosynthesis C-methylase UbiE